MKDTLNPNEWIVMNALWEHSPATLSEVIATIGERADWNYKTYQSYLLVLEKKGFIAAEKRGRDKFYAPIVSRECCVEQEKNSLFAKMEASSIKLLIASMVRESDLDAQTCRTLSVMLDDLLKKEGQS